VWLPLAALADAVVAMDRLDGNAHGGLATRLGCLVTCEVGLAPAAVSGPNWIS
jgi:hypothetical protein